MCKSERKETDNEFVNGGSGVGDSQDSVCITILLGTVSK